MLQKIWNKKNKKGFTLVELMVVVAIIAILIAIAVPIYGAITENAERTACQANQRTVDSAIMQVYAGIGTWVDNTNIANLDKASNYGITTKTAVGPFLKKKDLSCPSSGTAYTVNADHEAVCTYAKDGKTHAR